MDCKLAAPLGFCRGFGPRFLLSSVTSCLLSFVASFAVFDFLGFSLNWFLITIAFDKKENAVSMLPGVRVFGRAKTNYIIAKHVYTRQFVRDCFPGVSFRGQNLHKRRPDWSPLGVTKSLSHAQMVSFRG